MTELHERTARVVVGDSTADDLEDFLAYETDYVASTYEGEETEPVEPPDPSRANYMLRRLSRLTAKRDETVELATREKQMIDAWASGRTNAIDGEIAWLKAGLEAFMRRHAAETRAKTLKLPNGELRLRPTTTTVEITDESAFLRWAVGPTDEYDDSADFMRAGTRHPEFVRVKIEPDKTALKRAGKPVGELELSEGRRLDEVGYLDDTGDGELVPIPGVALAAKVDTEGKPALRFEVGS